MDFLQIPKACGTSICACIDSKTQSWGYYRADLIPEAKLKRVWAVIRNPYDRAVSIYHHANREIENPLSFYQWWKNDESFVIGSDVSFLHSPLVHYLTIDGKLAVPKIVEFADVPDFMKRTFNKELPHLNKTPDRKLYKEYYNDKSFNLITEIFKDDLSMFNYQW